MKILTIAIAITGLTITYAYCQVPTPDISGDWACVKGCLCTPQDRNPSIVQTGTGLTLNNECSSHPAVQGKVTSPTTFIAYGWKLTGNIADNGNRLIFSNATEWVRQ